MPRFLIPFGLILVLFSILCYFGSNGQTTNCLGEHRQCGNWRQRGKPCCHSSGPRCTDWTRYPPGPTGCKHIKCRKYRGQGLTSAYCLRHSYGYLGAGG